SAAGDVYVRQVDGTSDNLTIGAVTALDTGFTTDGTVANLNGAATTANNGKVTVSVANGTLTLTKDVSANGTGTVDLRANGATSDIAINGATVTSTNGGTVQLVAGQSITTNTATGTTSEIKTTGNVLLKAGAGIGTSTNRVELEDVGTLAATAAGSAAGDVYVRQVDGTSDNLTIGAVTALDTGFTTDGTVANLNGVATTANNGKVTVTVANGTLTLTKDVSANGTGTVDLRANGATSDIAINGATVTSTNG